MAYLVPQSSNPNLKKFIALRRTAEGMLYLTEIDRQNSTDEVQVSKYFEEGKSELVPKDGTDYVEERLELFNSQSFSGDGSTKAFTVSTSGLSATGIAVFVDGTRKTIFTDYSFSGTTLTFVLPPANGKAIVVAQINKRYFNNDSDKYQQFTYDFDATYLINSSGELVKRENKTVSRSQLVSDDFETFESTASVNSTTYQDAV
jgi:hypothetical protein